MKCVVCKGDDIRTTEVKEELARGDDIVYMTISIPVCRNCGERYYDLRTMHRLEEAKKKLLDNQLDLRQVGRVMEAV